jgi:hypothetical protein
MSRWEAALIRNPILKVLSTFSRHNVKALLMGGQACILYGAAEFSRDSDFVVLADKDNLDLLQSVLRELQAEVMKRFFSGSGRVELLKFCAVFVRHTQIRQH